MKNFIFATIIALFGATGIANAADASATVSVTSDNVYRGQVISDDVSVGLGLRFDDVIFPGVYVRGDFNSVELTPLSDTIRFRSDAGVGIAGTYGAFGLDASVNRVFNPIVYSADYTEARLRATAGIFFAELGQGITSGVNKDTYVATGVEIAATDRLSIGGLVSAYRYDDGTRAITRDNSRFNNAEVYASYNVARNLDIFANYTYGLRDAFGTDIDNRVYGGIRYRF